MIHFHTHMRMPSRLSIYLSSSYTSTYTVVHYFSLSYSHFYRNAYNIHITVTCSFCRSHFHTDRTNTCFYYTNVLSTHTQIRWVVYRFILYNPAYALCVSKYNNWEVDKKKQLPSLKKKFIWKDYVLLNIWYKLNFF